MRSIDSLFSEYGESHQNPTNKIIHWICVPLIFFSLIALIAAIPSEWLKSWFPEDWRPYIHLGTVLITFAFLYYLRLSLTMAIGLLLFNLLCLQGIIWLSYVGIPLWSSSLIIFVAAWIGQFIGHNIEGKKPSFLKDIQFLAIGPAWLMSFIYRKMGIPY